MRLLIESLCFFIAAQSRFLMSRISDADRRVFSFWTTCREQQERGSQGETVGTRPRKPRIPNGGNVLMFDKGVGLDLRNKLQQRAQSRQIEAERMSAIGRMACSISDDMRH